MAEQKKKKGRAKAKGNAKGAGYSADWAEAKKRCRLNQEEVEMAKELGFSPKTLIRNIPSPKEQWKAPVKVWIRDLYEEKHPGKHPAVRYHREEGFMEVLGDEEDDEWLPFR